MERDIEKDLIEIECAIKSQKEKENIFTMSVLQRCYKLVSQLKEYKDLEEQNKLLKLPCAVGDTVYYSDNEYYFTVLPVKVDEIHLLINSKIPHYSNEKKNSCKRKIQEIMRKYDCDEDFIDTINDDFCRGFGTARDIIFEFLKEGYWKQREN